MNTVARRFGGWEGLCFSEEGDWGQINVENKTVELVVKDLLLADNRKKKIFLANILMTNSHGRDAFCASDGSWHKAFWRWLQSLLTDGTAKTSVVCISIIYPHLLRKYYIIVIISVSIFHTVDSRNTMSYKDKYSDSINRSIDRSIDQSTQTRCRLDIWQHYQSKLLICRSGDLVVTLIVNRTLCFKTGSFA